MQTETVFMGVDVAKAELAIARSDRPKALERVSNDPGSIAAWLQTLPAQALIGMESTGRYHRLLAELAVQAGRRVFLLNARDVYFYAQQLGMRAKTDRLDAYRVACYLAEHHRHLHPWQPPSAVQESVQRLLQRRARVVMHQGAIRQCLRDTPELRSAARALEQHLEQFLQQLDQQLARLIASDARLEQGCRRLRTIPGIGPQTSSLLAALLSRVPFANADALVAFCGLDPRAIDSGTKRGRRRLTKRGPALLRRQLWLAGFSATRTKTIQPLYQKLLARGLATTEAVMIIGRKLLRIAFALWRSAEDFKPERLSPQTT